MSYSDLLRDPRWQRKRLEVMQRDGFACRRCGDTTTTLNVHHDKYVHGRKPWEYPDDELRTLCEPCHGHEHGKPTWRAPDARQVARRASEANDLRAAAAEWELVRLLVHRPSYIEQVAERIGADSFHDSDVSQLFGALLWHGAEAGFDAIAGSLDDRALTVMQAMLEETEGLARPDETIARNLWVLAKRDLIERIAETDALLRLANRDEQDALIREKLRLRDELAILGTRQWGRGR